MYTRPESEREILPALPITDSCIFRFYVDDAKTEDDVNWRHLEVIYDGKPESDVFVVVPHWHTDHSENWTMLEGRMIATINGKDIEMKVGDPTVVIPAGVVHCFRSIKGVPAVLKECSGPPGEFKMLNMRDIFQNGLPSFWLAIRASWDGATYRHLGGPLILDQLFMYILWPVAKLIAPGKPFDGPTRVPRSSKKKQ